MFTGSFTQLCLECVYYFRVLVPVKSEGTFVGSLYKVCVPTVGLCCHLLVVLGNDTSVQESGKSG